MEPLLPPKSEAARVFALSPEDFAKWLKSKSDAELARIEYDWPFWRRADQVPPARDWRLWLILAGRGYGKTRIGAEWVRAHAEADGNVHIALVASTATDGRNVMIEGPSGLLNCAPERSRPIWEPSLKRLTWSNGATATLYSAAEPDSLRGPAHNFAWCDEVAKWDRSEAVWNNLMMTMRVGNNPQIVATTTPRSMALIRRLKADQDTALSNGRMEDNADNLPESWIKAMRRTYDGTRLGRQELDGLLIEDYEGALWSRALVEARRVAVPPALRRVVVGVDPPAGTASGEGGDACGIVAVGLGEDGFAYVIEDASVAAKTPEIWARAVADCCARVGADKVVAEANNGGQMVASVLRAADMGMPVRLVHASHGKVARAEPVAMLYTNQRAYHAGVFPALEDELCGLVVGGAYQGPGRSPDRADALVWAMTELMLGVRRGEPSIRLL